MVGITAALIGSAVLGAGASILSGNKAAKAQQEGTAQGIAEQRREYDQTRADFEPWRTAGAGALTRLQQLYGLSPAPVGADGQPLSPTDMIAQTPGYQFRFNEGQRAVERSAAARGLLKSGASMKAIARFGDGLASSEYDATARRLAELSGVGVGATNSTAASGNATSNNIANLYLQNGNAQASSYLNTGSSINQGINNILGAYMFNRSGYGK